jgi:hypothetical protein
LWGNCPSEVYILIRETVGVKEIIETITPDNKDIVLENSHFRKDKQRRQSIECRRKDRACCCLERGQKADSVTEVRNKMGARWETVERQVRLRSPWAIYFILTILHKYVSYII